MHFVYFSFEMLKGGAIMIVDYHIHTKYSPDAAGNIEDYIKEAKKNGIDEIGFSEHMILHYESDYSYRSPDFIKTYIQKFLEIRKNSEIPIKLGAEIDFFPKDIEKIREFIQKYPFDYVIGSVHYLGTWAIDSRSQIHEYLKRDMLQVYEEYFGTVRKLCQSRLFDILGHADLIKLFGFNPNCNFDYVMKETVEAIVENNMCVEVNTSGLVRPCAEIYPSKQFLTLLKQNKVPITLGSDAHNPRDVGRHFDKALKLMKEVGYNQVCTFEARMRKIKEV
jgi:histidinol-phosphatase (PHP family)